MAKPTDTERLAKQLLTGATPEEGRALLESLLSGRAAASPAGGSARPTAMDLTSLVVAVRDTARALGLVTVRKGRLTPTVAGARCRHDPQALWGHIVGRLPLGTKDFDRQAGWLALAVIRQD